MSAENNQNETETGRIRKMFSLSEDSASHEEIRSRLLDGGGKSLEQICVCWYVQWLLLLLVLI